MDVDEQEPTWEQREWAESLYTVPRELLPEAALGELLGRVLCQGEEIRAWERPHAFGPSTWYLWVKGQRIDVRTWVILWGQVRA